MATSVCQMCGASPCTCSVEETAPLQLQTDQFDTISLCWGITDDGFVAFSDDAKLLKGACGKSLASFPYGCFFSTSIGELRSYKSPKKKIIVVPAAEEEMWGATFKVIQSRPPNVNTKAWLRTSFQKLDNYFKLNPRIGGSAV